MFQRRWRVRRLRTAIGGALLILLALLAAKIHACACTGGRPQWHSVYPSTQEAGQG